MYSKEEVSDQLTLQRAVLEALQCIQLEFQSAFRSVWYLINPEGIDVPP